MKYYLQLTRFLSISLVTLITLLSVNSFAANGERLAWTVIHPEDSNITIQQQRVMNTLEATLFELDSVIDKKISEGKISLDSDFTLNKDVTLVYDYLMFRIYELTKVDRQIRNDLESESTSQYQSMRMDYDKKGARFFTSLNSLKRAVLIKDIQAEIKNLRNSLGELRTAMNTYSKYSVSIAAR